MTLVPIFTKFHSSVERIEMPISHQEMLGMPHSSPFARSKENFTVRLVDTQGLVVSYSFTAVLEPRESTIFPQDRELTLDDRRHLKELRDTIDTILKT